ncbi:MAG: helix-turn-helix domain-containing protein, partial [Sneathiella sp.]
MATKKNLPLGDDKKQPSLGLKGKHQQEGVSSTRFQDSEKTYGENIVFTVGSRLRAEREAKGLSLQDVADLIRLRPRQIKALEEGDYGSLPGQAFVVGFLKSYANELGLDAVEIVALYRSEEAGHLGAPQLAFPQPTSEGRKPGVNILIGTSIAAMVAVGGWYFYLDENKINLELVPDLPHQLSEKVRANTADTPAAGDTTLSSSEAEPESEVVAEVIPDTSPEANAPIVPETSESEELVSPSAALTKSVSPEISKEETPAQASEVIVADLQKELPEEISVLPPLTPEVTEDKNENALPVSPDTEKDIAVLP